MAKGTAAKAKIVETLRAAFQDDFICESDKKVYLWADDDGEQVQVALSMTCPKTPIEANAPRSSGSGEEPSEEDMLNILNLMNII